MLIIKIALSAGSSRMTIPIFMLLLSGRSRSSILACRKLECGSWIAYLALICLDPTIHTYPWNSLRHFFYLINQSLFSCTMARTRCYVRYVRSPGYRRRHVRSLQYPPPPPPPPPW